MSFKKRALLILPGLHGDKVQPSDSSGFSCDRSFLAWVLLRQQYTAMHDESDLVPAFVRSLRKKA